MTEHRTKKKARYYKKRLKLHWRRTLYHQVAAYFVVLVLWSFSGPNPIRMLALTFHELSHAIGGLLTGGNVFGFAISTHEGGVTIGTGGNAFVILTAGHIGSALWGVLLYYLSVRWNPIDCLRALFLVVAGSAVFGWLNDATIFAGLGSMAIMAGLFRAPDAVKLFFVRMVGSACCVYAPLDVITELFSAGGLPVGGESTPSDIHQLSELLSVSPLLIASVIIVLQCTLLVFLIRWTCSAGAKRAVKQEAEERRRQKIIWQDIHPEQRRITIR